MNTKKSGFSLIELLVVIVIMGILATVAFGNFGGFFAKARDSNRRAAVATLNTAITADRVGHEFSYDITEDAEHENASDTAAYINTIMDNMMANNDIELDGKGCYYAGFGTGTNNNQYFIAFVTEEKEQWDGFASHKAIVDSFKGEASDITDFDSGCEGASISVTYTDDTDWDNADLGEFSPNL